MRPPAADARRPRRALASATLVVLAGAALACSSGLPEMISGPSVPAVSEPGPQTLAHYDIRPEKLPPPNATKSAENGPQVVAKPDGVSLVMPDGFSMSVYAEGFRAPRWMALAPNGDVFVTESESDKITVLTDANGDGVAEGRATFATGLAHPFGLAFHDKYLYVGDTDAVVRFDYQPGQREAAGPPEKLVTLPSNGYREHWTRNVVFNPAGTKMYVTVGSKSNVDAEPEPLRASISEYNPDGTGGRIYASGTRNPVGLAFQPGTVTLWAAVQERDLLGDDLVPDYVTAVADGGFYGWPFAYMGPNEDPRRKGERPDLVKATLVPSVLLQAHSAPLGLTFYDGQMFPAEYRRDAFVALHGSWNRSKRTGYKIARIHFVDGKPAGGYDDFVKGWMLAEDSPKVWGRPVGLLVLKDGSMLVADDGANKIWRLTYSGK